MFNDILRDMVAIVTGAGNGIGRAEALALAAYGVVVIVNDIDNESAETVANEIEKAGGRAEVYVGDVSSWTVAEGMVDKAISGNGGLHIVINNAGTIKDRMCFNMNEIEWDTVVGVHLKGSFGLIRFASEYWHGLYKSNGAPVYGRIINTTSRAGLLGNAGQSNYVAAKGGIAAMTICIAREMEKYGVTCNAVAPRAYTRLMKQTFGAFRTEDVDKWSPARIAPFVVFLCSPLAQSITGQVFCVYGNTIALMKAWSYYCFLTSEDGWDIENIQRHASNLFVGIESRPARFDVTDDYPLETGQVT